MYQGTTPTLLFDLSASKNLNLDNVSLIWVTIRNFVYKRTWETERCVVDVEHKTIRITLTQAETLEIPKGYAYVQIRLLMTGGVALSTEIVRINVDENLEGGIIE